MNQQPLERLKERFAEWAARCATPEETAEITSLLSSVESDFSNLNFKYERTNKDKLISNSLLRHTSEDLTKAWQETEESRQQYQLLANNSPLPVVVRNLETGKVLYINQTACDLFETTPGASIGSLGSAHYMNPEDRQRILQLVRQLGRIDNFEIRLKTPSGREIWGLLNAVLTTYAGEPAMQTVFLDMTARMQAEAALVESERRFRDLMEQVQLVSAMLDIQGNITFANDCFLHLTGWKREEVLGRNWFDLFVPPQAAVRHDLFQELSAGTVPLHYENEILARSGERRLIAWSNTVLRDGQGGITGIAGIGVDITERKQMEEKLLRSQRMESIGALAGGVAHDLNNILAPIMMSASMLNAEDMPPDLREDLVKSIEAAAHRGGHIVNQVLTFARGIKGERTVLRPESLLEEIREIARETFPKSISLDVASDEGLWNVIGDATQLHQVLLNLCVNARDAMQNGGSLMLSAENIEVDELHASMQTDVKAGRYVKYKVMDSGIGIDPNHLSKIFDPFFTTKGPGIGTGLGLSTVLGIVRSHGGFVKVVSELGKGTTFEVFIPASNEAAFEAGHSEVSHPASVGQGEMILLVEDEPEILNVTKALLEMNGYVVLGASDGVEALACYGRHSGEIRLVITDLMMPNMDGANLCRFLRQNSPALPILVASGYGTEAVQNELAGLCVHTFLKKPFNAALLLQTIHSTMQVPSGERNGDVYSNRMGSASRSGILPS